MRSSYSEEDVILLLKDITGLVEPQPAKVREKLIQSGNITARCCLLNMFLQISICRYIIMR